VRAANERQITELELSEHELSEIRMLIEERTGICFDKSRERFLVTRVREHLHARGFERGTDLLRAARKTNVEYEALLERLLTQETTFFRYPAVYEAFQKRALPELHIKKFWKNPRTLRIWSAGCSTGEEPYSIAITIAGTLSFADAWKTAASLICFTIAFACWPKRLSNGLGKQVSITSRPTAKSIRRCGAPRSVAAFSLLAQRLSSCSSPTAACRPSSRVSWPV